MVFSLFPLISLIPSPQSPLPLIPRGGPEFPSPQSLAPTIYFFQRETIDFKQTVIQ
ncbi:hypothetical protein FDUTEX481_07807 [Tolypothrix sp. PCC 7601]|nr:hypothetical protein FDUTEX481_07807 [Tolypothrix sp. PCC 7601]